jgi:hypothetical protein
MGKRRAALCTQFLVDSGADHVFPGRPADTCVCCSDTGVTKAGSALPAFGRPPGAAESAPLARRLRRTVQEDVMDQRDRKSTDFSLEDPLGIEREPVPSTAADHLKDSGNEAADLRRRRARAGLDGHEYDERRRPGMGDVNVNSDGVEGTDMGYGGGGTDVEP